MQGTFCIECKQTASPRGEKVVIERELHTHTHHKRSWGKKDADMENGGPSEGLEAQLASQQALTEGHVLTRIQSKV